MNLSSCPRRNEAFQVQDLDGDLLLYDPQGTQILKLNPTGALVFRLCDGERTVSEIINILKAAYPDASDAISEDVIDIISQCQTRGCIDPA